MSANLCWLKSKLASNNTCKERRMHTGCTVVHMSVDASMTDSMFMVGSRLDYYSTRYFSDVYMYAALFM